MEGLGVAASVVAVSTIGLQSTKFIYQTLCGIKVGSKAVIKLAMATEDLSKLLEQIKGLAQRAKETLGEHEAKFFEDFFVPDALTSLNGRLCLGIELLLLGAVTLE